jgi:hypothetical protein
MNLPELKNEKVENAFRYIIEMSPMSNNDEYIYYLNKDNVPIEEFPIVNNGFNEPRIVLVRPVFKIENLNFKFEGSKFDEKVDEITLLLDSYYQLIDKFKWFKKINDTQKENNSEITSIEEMLGMLIGSEYYDCMSGGMTPGKSQLLIYIIEKYKLKTDVYTYPKMDGNNESNPYYTIQDFIDELKDKNYLENNVKLLEF